MLASLSKLTELSGYDRRTVAAKLVDTPFRPGPKNAKLFAIDVAMRALFGSASGNGSGEVLDAQQEKAMLDRARRIVVETEHKVRIAPVHPPAVQPSRLLKPRGQT
jgi:hypothetical protein